MIILEKEQLFLRQKIKVFLLKKKKKKLKGGDRRGVGWAPSDRTVREWTCDKGVHLEGPDWYTAVSPGLVTYLYR